MGLADVYLVVECSGARLALPAAAVAEVVLLPRLAAPAGMPAAVEGVMNLRGSPVPVLRLARLLGLAVPRPGAFAPVVVLHGPPPWGVLVERAVEVASLATVSPAPPGTAFNDCVVGFAGALPVLSPARLLGERERLALADFRALAARRLEEWTGAPA